MQSDPASCRGPALSPEDPGHLFTCLQRKEIHGITDIKGFSVAV